MASILRSGKFVRYFAGFARNIVFNTSRDVPLNVRQNSPIICSGFSQGFATSVSRDHNLDRSIQKLDQDVRKVGRITRRDIEEVLEEIRQHRTPTSSQSLLVIRCCGNLVPEELPEVRTALVRDIWQTLIKLKVPMDISHYNALLRVFLENEHPFSPTEFLADLESRGIEPNRVTYQRLISRYCQEGNIDGATRILEFMREKQLPINEHVFNALITGHAEADDLQSAVGILSVMKDAGLQPSSETYKTLMCSYAKIGDINSILSTLNTCESKEIHLLGCDLMDVIYALSTSGHSDKVDEILPHIRKSAGYNQDAKNVILRLVNVGQEDVAMKVLKTMPRGMTPEGVEFDTGNFFIKQLVKAKCPADKLMAICKELQASNLNSRAYLLAYEASASAGMIDLAISFLKEIKANDLPVRQHYFWPLFCAAGKTGADDVLDVIHFMKSEFDLTPSSNSVRDFVVPNLKESNYENILKTLYKGGLSVSTAITSTVHYALSKDDLSNAAKIATTANVFYQPYIYRLPLVRALESTKDFKSYVSLVRTIYENVPRLQLFNASQRGGEEEIEPNDEAAILKQPEVLGNFVWDAVTHFQKDRATVVKNILSGLVEQGLTISSEKAEKIQEKLGSELTGEISTLLGKLATGELEPTSYEKQPSQFANYYELLPVAKLEKLVEESEEKGVPRKNLYNYLMMAYVKEKDMEKAESFVKKLEGIDFVVQNRVFALMIDAYCNANAVDKALELHKNLKAKMPDFVLDELKTMKIVQELTDNDRLDEAIAFLTENRKAEKSAEELSFTYRSICFRILNALAEKGNEEGVQRMFDAMDQNNFITTNTILLGPLIKVHMVNENIAKAMDTFEQISTKYQCTPWKREICCMLIQTEDAANLQRLTDLSTAIHGEVNSLYDLVFSFVECGRIRQARKILETPELQKRPHRFNAVCEYYQQEGKVDHLESLVEATRDMNYINRNDLFFNLLMIYCKEDQPEKALALWVKAQEEKDVRLSDKFLIKLGEYLKAKDIAVPFIIPNETNKKKKNEEKNEKNNKSEETRGVAVQSRNNGQLEALIVAGNIDDAITVKKGLKLKNREEINFSTRILELMVQQKRMDEAKTLLFEMLNANIFPSGRTFRFCLSELARIGDYATLEKISENLTLTLKKKVGIDNQICRAYVAEGKAEEFLNILEGKLDAAKTDEQLRQVEDNFPKGGIHAVLLTHPELMDRFEKMAEKYATKGILSPMNIVWMHQLTQGDCDSAKRTFEKHLANSNRIMFEYVMDKAHKETNEQLARNLINALKDAKLSEPAVGIAHSCLIQLLSKEGKFDESLQAIDEAIKDVCLENIRRSALLSVKKGIEASGKTFPHIIPSRGNAKQDTSSSSSSSDDEPPAKK